MQTKHPGLTQGLHQSAELEQIKHEAPASLFCTRDRPAGRPSVCLFTSGASLTVALFKKLPVAAIVYITMRCQRAGALALTHCC